MEERNENCRDARLPNEVVETYRHPQPLEVVETYVRPLPPGHPAAQKPAVNKKRRAMGKKGLWTFLVCFLLLALLTAAAALVYELVEAGRQPEEDDGGGDFPNYGEYLYPADSESPSDTEVNLSTFPFGQGAELTVLQEHGEVLTPQEIYSRVNPSVAVVMAFRGSRASLGSGVIFTDDGYVITNYHVVQKSNACAVVLPSGHQYEALYVAGDAAYDLAILKVDARDLPTVEFGDSDLLSVGDPAYAIGNPLGYELMGTLTDGIISAVNRKMDVDGRDMTLIQTNAALNIGNSGGPLINQYGQVVGINVIKMNSSYFDAEGLGFAIPTSVMHRVVNSLLTYGEVKPEPLLGVSVMQDATQAADGIWGLEVVELVEGGAAARAGIQVGDWLLSADGIPLHTSNDLLRVRRTHYVGEEMKIVRWRAGEQTEVTLDLLENTAE